MASNVLAQSDTLSLLDEGRLRRCHVSSPLDERAGMRSNLTASASDTLALLSCTESNPRRSKRLGSICLSGRNNENPVQSAQGEKQMMPSARTTLVLFNWSIALQNREVML